jgi:Leucine-rich repeat (LRR) protein
MLEAIARTYLSNDLQSIAAIAQACRHFATTAWASVTRLVVKEQMQLPDSILINKLTHLTILDFRNAGLDGLANLTPDGLLALAPRLVELHFGYHVRGLTYKRMTGPVILQMIQLRALTLPRSGLGVPIHLSELAKLPNLTSLNTGKDSLELNGGDAAFPATLVRLVALDTQVPLTVLTIRLMGQLRALDMGDYGRVTDRHLLQLPRLEYLLLSHFGSSVTDASLHTLTQLRVLDLDACPNMRNATLVKLTRLEVLNLGYSSEHVTDAGLAPLVNLTALDLGAQLGIQSRVTDAGLVPLKNLTALDVSDSNITVAGLQQLPRLRYLDKGTSNVVRNAIDPATQMRGFPALRSLLPALTHVIPRYSYTAQDDTEQDGEAYGFSSNWYGIDCRVYFETI